MDKTKLLERIAYVKPVDKPDIHYLNELCVAYAASVPFDTFDLFGGEGKVWDLEKIYEKIVNQRRGGFCYELNELFRWLLTELGFSVERLRANHFVQDTSSFVENSDHLALLVTLDGEKWLTDVGWGGSAFRLPLKLGQLGEEQRQPNGIYRIEKHEDKYMLLKKKQVYLKTEDDKVRYENAKDEAAGKYTKAPVIAWNTIYRFKLQPCGFEDIEGDFAAQRSADIFTSAPIASVQTSTTRKVLFGYRYVEKQWINPETIKLVGEKQCTKDEVYRVLEDEFGIVLAFDLKDHDEVEPKMVAARGSIAPLILGNDSEVGNC